MICLARPVAVIFIFALVVCPIVFVLGVIDKHPVVGKSPELSFDQLKRIEQLVRRYKPYSMSVRQSRRVTISQTDLNLMATYGAAQFVDRVAVFPRISLSDSTINISATVKIPRTPLGEYINTACVLASENGRLRVRSIRAGFITLPGKLITVGLSHLGQALLAPDEYQLALQTLNAVHSVSIRGQQLHFIYDWNPQALSQLHESQKSMLIAPEHQYRLVVYTNALTEICATFKECGVKKVSMVQVVRPLFTLALAQSRVSGKPVEENRALLQAVSLFCLGRGVEHFVSKERALDIKPPERIALTVWGRDDLVKHFFVSAGIAVSGGTKLSNFAGLAKEVDDSGGDSGFSFADLAADRAGVRFAEFATGSDQKASAVQQKMANAKTADQFMPLIGNLPEGIMELQFKKRYADFDSTAYTLVEDEIMRRINACPVYQYAPINSP